MYAINILFVIWKEIIFSLINFCVVRFEWVLDIPPVFILFICHQNTRLDSSHARARSIIIRECRDFLRVSRTEHFKTFSRFLFKNDTNDTFKRGLLYKIFGIYRHLSTLKSLVDLDLSRRPSAALRKTLLQLKENKAIEFRGKTIDLKCMLQTLASIPQL